MTAPSSRKSLADLIVGMDERGSLDAVRRRLEAGEDPSELMGECRLGMERVGELYEQGAYFISALIMAGEIFREAAEILVPRLETPTRPPLSGRMVIATVKGDIHDIGKNIAITLLEANGFEIIDLGVDVPAERIVDAVEAERPGILGLSCLLTGGFSSMKKAIAAVRGGAGGWGAQLPIIIGGAPLDQTVCDEVGADGWCTDAAGGIEVVRSLLV
jgi:methanogenic corrinoid protein MtbC1